MSATVQQLEERLEELEKQLALRDQRLASLLATYNWAKKKKPAENPGSSHDEEQRKILKPTVSSVRATELLNDLYGITILRPLKELDSYDDVNFLVVAQGTEGGGEQRFTLKIHNGVESKDNGILEAQNKMMLHIRASSIPCPAPVPNCTGDLISFASLDTLGGGSCRLAVRLLTWVHGATMSDIGSDEETLELSGLFLGKITSALRGFDHRSAHRDHAWDVAKTSSIRGFTKHITEPKRRCLVESVLDAFEREAKPAASSLDKAIIMGDFNDANVILATGSDVLPCDKIVGIIDFGDMVYTWRVNEIAIAMAYAMLSSWGKAGNHCAAAVAVLRGFARTCHVQEGEIRMLRVLVACRLACSYTYGMYSFSKDPSNKYLLLHASPAGRALEVWWQEASEDALLDLIRSAVSNHYPLKWEMNLTKQKKTVPSGDQSGHEMEEGSSNDVLVTS